MKLADLLLEGGPQKSTFDDAEIELAYKDIRKSPEYYRIRAFDYVDVSTKIQQKRGNFEFRNDDKGKTYKVYAHGMIRVQGSRSHTKLTVPTLTDDDLFENYKIMLRRVGDIIEAAATGKTLKKVGNKPTANTLQLVNGELNIISQDIKTLVGSPNKVKNLKIVNNSYLEDLTGAPETVAGDVTIHNCWIKSLRGFPKTATSVYLSGLKELESLEGLPSTVKTIVISDCPNITSLDGLPESLTSLTLRALSLDTLKGFGTKFVKRCGKLDVSDVYAKSHMLALLIVSNSKTRTYYYGARIKDSYGVKAIKVLDIIAKHISKGKDGMIDCQSDLIDAGFDEQAQA